MARLQAEAPFLHPECQITDSWFGRYVEIGAGSRIANSAVGDYSYCDRTCDIANAKIGKFSNIASFVRIGATDHPMEKASLHHFHYRSGDYWDDAEHGANAGGLQKLTSCCHNSHSLLKYPAPWQDSCLVIFRRHIPAATGRFAGRP